MPTCALESFSVQNGANLLLPWSHQIMAQSFAVAYDISMYGSNKTLPLRKCTMEPSSFESYSVT